MSGWLWLSIGVAVVDVAAYIIPRAYARFCDGIGENMADWINYSRYGWSWGR